MTIAHNKTRTIEDAISRIHDGATVFIGGFGIPGTPFCLIKELVRQGQKDLTIIKNDANEKGMGVDWLLDSGQVKRLVTSHIGLNANAVQKMTSGEIDVEFVPQGILAERIHAAGAGLPGFITDIGMGTSLAEGKQSVALDGQDYVLERALSADFALLHAGAADKVGNLTYRASGRNFNPSMAMAARFTIAETHCVVDVGAIAQDAVHTPAPFVDVVVPLSELPEVYGVNRR